MRENGKWIIDLIAYDDPEIVYRAKKKHHAGLIVRSPKHERVTD